MKTNKPEVFEVYRTRQGALENVVLLADYEALQAEYERLRKAIRRLCNIYVVDDYYSGDIREEHLNRAVERAIDAAMHEEDK